MRCGWRNGSEGWLAGAANFPAAAALLEQYAFRRNRNGCSKFLFCRVIEPEKSDNFS
jgi:hypothetical protein